MATVLGVLAYEQLRERRKRFKSQQKQAEAANELLRTAVPPLRGADRPPVHVADEMGDEALALTRRFVDTAFKPADDWEDWDVIEQFQPAALRYQIDHLIYTMALQKYARTPAFRGYHDEAMRRLIEKYQEKKVWSYWAYENLWGNFEWNPDPARKQNIMLTGFFALSLGAYQTVTGDYRHEEVGSIEFKWNEKRRYPYSYDTLCASLTSDYLKSPWGLVVCEPNWIYSICNMRGAEGLMIHDRLHGTHYWDMIKDGYFRGMEQEFVRPDGMLNFYRSARTGIGQNGASFSNDLRPVAPHLADRGWTLLRAAFQEQDGKLVTPLIKRDKLLDTGNYSFHPLKSYCYIIDEAREAGDEPAAEAAWDEVKDRIDMKIDDRGWLVVEDASLSSHVALSRALVGRKAGWLDMIEKGMPKEWLDGPQLESVPYPQVLVSRAVTDGKALDAVLRSTNGGGRVAVELSQLRPGGAVLGHGRGRLRASRPTTRAAHPCRSTSTGAASFASRRPRKERRMPAPPKPPDTSVEARKNGLPGLLATEREMLAKRIADAPAMWISIPMWGRVFNAYRKLLATGSGSDDHHPGERRPHRRPLDAQPRRADGARHLARHRGARRAGHARRRAGHGGARSSPRARRSTRARGRGCPRTSARRCSRARASC